MKRTVPLIVGNWKLHPNTEEEAATLARDVAKKQKKAEAPYVAVAPSFLHLGAVAKKIKNSTAALAAQDVSETPSGAFTGEVSAAQLKDAGVDFGIVGHSERRAMGETDEQVGRKVQLLLKHRITPIVCIGEHSRDDSGAFFTFVADQLQALYKDLTAANAKKVIIAYEPIWAIGTGNTATVEDVKEMQLFVESVITKQFDRPTARAVRILYGGSVKPHNAKELTDGGGMNGFLVGGASLDADSFGEICQLAIS